MGEPLSASRAARAQQPKQLSNMWKYAATGAGAIAGGMAVAGMVTGAIPLLIGTGAIAGGLVAYKLASTAVNTVNAQMRKNANLAKNRASTEKQAEKALGYKIR